MLQVVLIRPGSTLYDDEGRIQGTLDVPLSQQGSAEVALLEQKLHGLRLSLIYHGPCQAARDTAETLGASLKTRTKRLDLLLNLNHGLWQGMLIDDVRQRHPKVYRQWQEHPETVCPPEGETLAEARQRIRAAVRMLLKKHDDQAVALVAPEPLASLLAVELGGGALGDLWKATDAHGRFEILTVEPSLVS